MGTTAKETRNYIYEYFPINNQEKRHKVEERAKRKARLKNQQGYKGVQYRVEDLGDKFAVVAELETV